MYKLDNLFRSIRVSDENSSVTSALHFFNLLQLQTFLRSVCTIQSNVINFQNFLTSFAIFYVVLICIELNNPEIKKATNEL